MSVSLRRFGVVAVAGLAALGALTPPAWGQIAIPGAGSARFATGVGFFPGQGGRRPMTVGLQGAANLTRINPRWFVAPGLTLNQHAYNVATLGRAYGTIPPYLLGYNPYPSVLNTGPVYAGGAYSPYGLYGSTLSTGYNPYLPGGGAGTLDAYGSGSTLSTYGGGSGGYGGYDPYYGYYYPNPTESVYRGAAEYLRAEADYYKGVEQARLLREQARQAAVDTRRRLLQEEMDYERLRPKAPDVRAREDEGDRRMAERARPTEVWSGRALNALLRSVASKGALGRGPNIPLEEDTLRGLNLTDGSSRGNLGLLKDTDRLGQVSTWPAALQERQYDGPRRRLVRDLRLAAAALKDKEAPDRATLKDLQAGYEALSKELEAGVGELSPSQYIEARRFLNQVRDAVRALADPGAAAWAPRGQTVAELVDYMTRNGLQFAPATPGDYRAYNAAFEALRAFERSLSAR